MMEYLETDGYGTNVLTDERPSPEFIRAVAELLDTDPVDLLDEMGYVMDSRISAV